MENNNTNKKEYTLDNIHEFFEELDAKLNPNISKMMVWAGYQRDKERQKKEKEIWQKYYNPNFPRIQYNVTLLTDDIAIVERTQNGVDFVYTPCVNGEVSDNYYFSFYQAMLAGLAIMFTGSDNGVGMLIKELDKE